MGRLKIHGSEYPLQKVFSDDFVFTIPRYQRPYSWTTEQSGELLDDVLTALGNGSDPVDELNPYFLGSVVLIKDETAPDAEVVDGQQRLSTLTILLSAIRSLVPPDFGGFLTKYLYEKADPITGNPDRYRLTLRQRDEGFFQTYVQKEDGIEKLSSLDPAQLTDSQKNILANALLFRARLQKLPDQQMLPRLAQFIVKQCLLVVVTTPDLDSAYRIFSVLNDRGLDLSHADILKAEIVGNVPQAQEALYAERWESIEDDLGRDAFADLFSHTRMIFRKAKLRETILKEFREYVVKQVGDSGKLIDAVLRPFAQSYADIKDAGYESTSKSDAINLLLRWLQRVDNTDWISSAIFYMSKNRSDPSALEKFFTDLERLAAGLMFLRFNINQRIERYGRVLANIEKNQDLYAPPSALQLSDEERKEILALLGSDLYTQAVPVRLYALLRLDSSLAGGGATYDYSTITVEHVLPQNPSPGSKWETWFPDPLQRSQCVHRLANLVLLTRRKNSQAGNYDFDKKKAEYFTTRKGISPFVLTTQVLQQPTWTPDTLQTRQGVLLGALKDLWRL